MIWFVLALGVAVLFVVSGRVLLQKILDVLEDDVNDV